MKIESSNNILEEFLNYRLFVVDGYIFSVHKIVQIVFVIILAKVIISVIKKGINRLNNRKGIQNDNFYTLIKIVSYTIWIISVIIILNILGVKLTALLTGSAALLVGIGLGLQQTFNDFISGIILLFEGKTKIGDILEVDDHILKLKNIGLRTTECINRDGISIIIPNSKIVTDKVINWTYQEKKTRFRIDVGVAYGSDIELVIKLLEEAAAEHDSITDKNLIEARFIDFGESSLNFQLLFFSLSIFRIEKVKSDIRRTINLKFNQNGIVVPFPQMDVYLKSDETKK